jgi:hypothetical protein
MERADRSSLRVFDQSGNVVLFVRYANKNTLLVQAKLQSDGRMITLGQNWLGESHDDEVVGIGGFCISAPSDPANKGKYIIAMF